jgi:hypothetical protein
MRFSSAAPASYSAKAPRSCGWPWSGALSNSAAGRPKMPSRRRRVAGRGIGPLQGRILDLENVEGSGREAGRNLAFVRVLHLSSTSDSRRVRTFSACAAAFGPAGTTSLGQCRSLVTRLSPAYTLTRRTQPDRTPILPRARRRGRPAAVIHRLLRAFRTTYSTTALLVSCLATL